MFGEGDERSSLIQQRTRRSASARAYGARMKLDLSSRSASTLAPASTVTGILEPAETLFRAEACSTVSARPTTSG
jgi:hypothetical protein